MGGKIAMLRNLILAASGAALTAGEDELRVQLVAHLQLQEAPHVTANTVFNITPDRMRPQAPI
jgi:hypothetical protein